jgi:hypothetical protein
LSFSLLFLLKAQQVALFLDSGASNFQSQLIVIVGLILLINGIHLAAASFQEKIRALEVYYFVTGDLLWVTATFGLIALQLFVTTPLGNLYALLVAFIVGGIGVLQVIALGNETITNASDDTLSTNYSVAHAIVLSWQSMKTWVKVWLIVLNLAFITGICTLPRPISWVILAAYLGSGPWLLVIMISQRGLTRFLGWAHILPWTPLVAYLCLQIWPGSIFYTSTTNTELGILITLLFLSTMCLIFDVFDVYRWLKGQKFRLGSANAFKANASKLASLKT